MSCFAKLAACSGLAPAPPESVGRIRGRAVLGGYGSGYYLPNSAGYTYFCSMQGNQ